MILIVGGTGKLGTMLVRRLTDRGLPVRVLTRSPARAAHLTEAHPNARVEIVRGDLRDPPSLQPAVRGVETIVAAAHGFGDSGDGSPDTVDRLGNANLVRAAAAVGADVILMSIVGAAQDSPMDLFRAKYDAEQQLRASGVRWTIVRATAFIETWATVMGQPLRETGKTMVFGRGENPINFVSVVDVAALLERVVIDTNVRGEIIEIGGGANVTFNQFAAALEQRIAHSAKARHIPRPVLRAMGLVLRGIKPALARHARAAVVMDTHDMTFDAARTRGRFPDLPNTDLVRGLETWLASSPTGRGS